MQNFVAVSVELSARQLAALVELLKCLGLGDCRVFAENEHEARLMLEAVQQVRISLAQAVPR